MTETDELKYAFYELCKRDPYEFLRLVKTYDPHNETTPIKSFPVDRPYIEPLVRLWEKEKLLIIAKSRQMILTWLFIALYDWDSIVNDNRYTFLKSEKLEHASNLKDPLSLLSRAVFIIEHLPIDFLWYCWGVECEIPRATQNPAIWTLPNGSTLKPVSQDPKEVRAKTATGVFDDEMAFQPWADQGYRAVMPVIGRMGRYTAVSTPNGKNFFWRKWADEE